MSLRSGGFITAALAVGAIAVASTSKNTPQKSAPIRTLHFEEAHRECRRIYDRTCPKTRCPCMCEYDSMSNGRECGGRAAHALDGGAKPICYPTDPQIKDGKVPYSTLLLHCRYSQASRH